MNKIRNFFHVILGFTLAYWACSHTHIAEMNEASMVLISIICSFFVGFILGVAIEYFQNKVLKQIFDEIDVLRTIIGGLLGGILFIFVKDLAFINKWMLIGCGVLCVLELIRIRLSKYKLLNR